MRRYAVIVCDTAVFISADWKEYYECAETSMVIDHHASNEGYGDIKLYKDIGGCAENVYIFLTRRSLRKR